MRARQATTKTRSSRILNNDSSTLTLVHPNTTQNMENTLERTPLLLLDYVQFLAARTIQSHWRSHYSRLLQDRRRKAAITIQRWWRGFNTRRKHFDFIEDMLQKRLLEYYNKSATKIQALFRGWWTRRTVHDVYALQNMQACAAADLLNCVAYKLHHLLRTYSIPGIYSLRNSNCLSRVEKLLASMNYRFHNGLVTVAMVQRQAQVKGNRQRFGNTKFMTPVPFAGHDYLGYCKPHCEEYIRRTKNMDKRMFSIIANYDKSLEEPASKKTHLSMAEKKRLRKLRKMIDKIEKRKCSFCADVIESMRRWKVWDNERIEISKNIFRNPENLESFINEASAIVDSIDGRCHCNISKFDEVQCH